MGAPASEFGQQRAVEGDGVIARAEELARRPAADARRRFVAPVRLALQLLISRRGQRKNKQAVDHHHGVIASRGAGFIVSSARG